MMDGMHHEPSFEDWQLEAKASGFPTPDEENYGTDWLNSFLDDPVLNDRMMTDAMQPPCIKSEHSYSISDNNGNGPSSPLGLNSQEDIDSDLFNPTPSALDLTMKSVATSPELKCEVTNPESFLTVQPVTSAPCHIAPLNLSPRQPTIIVTTTQVATSSHSQPTTAVFNGETISLPAIQIKQEPGDCMDQSHEQTVNLESILYPLTPPGSSGSDSDGSQSPHRSAPGSPIRHTLRHDTPSLSPPTLTAGKPYTQPLFVNPISQSGVLILSEEEKRTLISEGYPIPSKLPLTKQEEKNLKKIRRKIKNKISAQESRRKKKEYLEALEKRVEAYNHENNDLKKKVENLENNNRSLLGQLQKLQSLVSKIPKGASATQTSTALMVVVFCFAVFLGSLSPSTLNIGYKTSPKQLAFVQPQEPTHHLDHDLDMHLDRHMDTEDMLPRATREGPGPHVIGPHLVKPGDNRPNSPAASADPYATPNLKSRMLMSVESEDSCEDPNSPPWQVAMSCPMPDSVDPAEAAYPEERSAPGVGLFGAGEITEVDHTLLELDATVLMVVTGGSENTSEPEYRQLSAVVPDITVSQRDLVQPPVGMRDKMAAESETSA